MSSWSCLKASLITSLCCIHPYQLWMFVFESASWERASKVKRHCRCCLWSQAVLWTDTYCIAPLHTGLDEGKWPFNRHDSHFDWELCPKASTLPASKAGQRLCSASSSPVAVVILVCCAMLLLRCLHGILRLVSLYFCIASTSSSIAFYCSPVPMRSHANMSMTCERVVWCECFTVQLNPSLTLRFVCGGRIEFTRQVDTCLENTQLAVGLR